LSQGQLLPKAVLAAAISQAADNAAGAVEAPARKVLASEVLAVLPGWPVLS
jgi:hypothetical protein